MIEFKNKIFEGSNKRKSLFDCRIPVGAKAVIIFAHGYKGFKDWGAWQLVEDYFVKAGFGFVKFNFSHNGGTVENPIDFDDLEAFANNRYSYEVMDLELIVEETYRIIKEECEINIPICLFGHSRGGGISILVGSNSKKVDAVVSLAGISSIANRFPEGEALAKWKNEGVFYSLNGRTKQEMPHFYSFYTDFKENEAELDIEAAIGILSKPFLQIHGDMDLAVSISEGLAIADWSETQLEIVKGADHTFGAKHPWEKPVLPFDLEIALNKAKNFLEQVVLHH
jgi:hypothetical protein